MDNSSPCWTPGCSSVTHVFIVLSSTICMITSEQAGCAFDVAWVLLTSSDKKSSTYGYPRNVCGCGIPIALDIGTACSSPTMRGLNFIEVAVKLYRAWSNSTRTKIPRLNSLLGDCRVVYVRLLKGCPITCEHWRLEAQATSLRRALLDRGSRGWKPRDSTREN